MPDVRELDPETFGAHLSQMKAALSDQQVLIEAVQAYKGVMMGQDVILPEMPPEFTAPAYSDEPWIEAETLEAYLLEAQTDPMFESEMQAVELAIQYLLLHWETFIQQIN